MRTLRFAHKQETHGRRGMYERLQVSAYVYLLFMCIHTKIVFICIYMYMCAYTYTDSSLPYKLWKEPVCLQFQAELS